ncbi:hypothetical protein ACFY1J_42045 [Streptomyces sp. NPDC001406]|uniref:hypothetical protein n=1 Tax=Streptomyces sp. NPDC001406 TaxID=3364572 RepID=UPI0036B6F235
MATPAPAPCFAYVLEAGEDLLTAGDLAARAHVTTGEAVYACHYKRLTALFADYSAEELAVLTDWFTRATELAHAYLEKLNRNDPQEEC